jgi:sugar phosphate isomerase/epimerase
MMEFKKSLTRREWILSASGGTAGLLLGGIVVSRSQAAANRQPLYKISCTEYSLHRLLAARKLDNLDFAPFVAKEFSLNAVEYWNAPFKNKVRDTSYLGQMRQRADDAGVQGTVILVDGEGHLGDPDPKLRDTAVDRHKKWIQCAVQLGCHSIRVNAHSEGSYDEQLALAADGLAKLSDFAAPAKINVLVENHGGLSSNGRWLAGVMQRVGKKNCGTLPDFGNFGSYDRYQGVRELMPYAKCVSAKSHDFDASGNEIGTDYLRMMKIVVDSGYHGYVGIEYEGNRLSEVEGVRATQRLLERVRNQLARV